MAYNLAKRGWKDILLLEKHKLTSGTTWHAAGLVGQLRHNKFATLLSAEALDVYANLEKETGLSTGYKQCGSLTTAATPERFEVFKRNAARARSYGLEAELMTPEECGRVMSHDGVDLIRTDDLYGGLWLPEDGSGSPTDLTMSMAKGARNLGVTIREGVAVSSFRTARVEGSLGYDKMVGVVTESGDVIDCDTVVLCTGQWTRQIAAKTLNVNVPLHSCEHFYVTTNTMKGVHPNLPVYRDNDSFTYFREWGTGLLVGGFEPKSKPIWTEGVPEHFEFGLLPDDYDHFMQIWEGASHRVPSLETAEINTFVNGPESFTQDNSYILGTPAECRGCYVAAGFNSAGIANAAGAGILLSEWIDNGGHATRDVWDVDIRRFGAFHRAPEFLRDRVQEVLGLHYAMPWPRKELSSARGLRLSPLYDAHREKGAVFGQKFGWERVNYFRSQDDVDADEEERYTIDEPPSWLDNVRSEHQHCRSHVAVFDVTSFAKLLVQGPDAEALMQRLCCADVGTIGKATYTGMLNEEGGYETDCTVTRLDETTFYVVSPTAQATRDADWIRRNVRVGDVSNREFVTITDVTSATSVLAVMGPRSRDLLSRLTFEDLSNESFPFGTVRDVSLGYTAARLCRMTYVGELGYEIYVPTESTRTLYEALHDASSSKGEDLQLRDCGYYAIDSLRCEKGYRAWGHELSVVDNPFEAGLSFTIDWGKDFLGKARLDTLRTQPLRQRLFSFVTDETGLPIWGGEPILLNGEAVGNVTSANYAHTIGGQIAMGYVAHDDVGTKGFARNAGVFEIDVGGTRLPVRPTLRPAFDPKNSRVQGNYA